MAAADRVAELPAVLARLAPGPQRLLATRTPASSTTSSTRRPRSSASTCRRTRTRLLSVADHCLRSRALRQRHRRRQAAGAELPVDGRGDRRTARAASASGTGRRTTTAASRTSCSACAGDVPTLETLAAAALLREHLPELKVRVVNVVDLMRLQPDTRAPARPVRRRVRRAVHHRQAGDLRLPRLPVADPPADLPAHATTPTSTCAGTRRRARRRRRSTW